MFPDYSYAMYKDKSYNGVGQWTPPIGVYLVDKK